VQVTDEAAVALVGGWIEELATQAYCEHDCTDCTGCP
jgi:hypothetical protein